jgi:hypothetical protein
LVYSLAILFGQNAAPVIDPDAGYWLLEKGVLLLFLYPNPDKPELNIDDLWYRFAASFI